jgi:hypothetical protein
MSPIGVNFNYVPQEVSMTMRAALVPALVAGFFALASRVS